MGNFSEQVWGESRERGHDLIAEFIRADYKLTDLANTLPEDVGGDEGIRRASYIYEDSETGENQLFEPAWIQSVISGGREVHRELDEAHRLVVDLSVVASGPVVDLAWEVLQGCTDSAVVAVWHFATQKQAWDPLTEARVKQKQFVTEARRLLGADIDLEQREHSARPRVGRLVRSRSWVSSVVVRSGSRRSRRSAGPRVKSRYPHDTLAPVPARHFPAG